MSTPIAKLAGYLALLTTVLVITAKDQPSQVVPLSPAAEEQLRGFLRTYLGAQADRTARYSAGLIDLNGDGTPEVMVHITGQSLCGTGGCLTLVLSSSYQVIGRITISRPPILVFRRKSKGWRDIGVWVEGGGIEPGHFSELSFDGKSYPNNPSVLPARPLKGPSDGVTCIAPAQQGRLVYD
jgi:hypothetical protein